MFPATPPMTAPPAAQPIATGPISEHRAAPNAAPASPRYMESPVLIATRPMPSPSMRPVPALTTGPALPANLPILRSRLAAGGAPVPPPGGRYAFEDFLGSLELRRWVFLSMIRLRATRLPPATPPEAQSKPSETLLMQGVSILRPWRLRGVATRRGSACGSTRRGVPR